MSRGDGRALDKAAEALRAECPSYLFHKEHAEMAIDAYLDALLSELPEEAVEAAKRAALAEVHGSPHEQSLEYSGHIEGTKAAAETAISTFLLSLRSFSREGNVMSQNDPWKDPETQRWVDHVLEEMVPKLADSDFAISIVPENRHTDVKFWVELGASICMDKPIIIVAPGDKPIAAKLALIADVVVRSIDPTELAAAIKKVTEKIEDNPSGV